MVVQKQDIVCVETQDIVFVQNQGMAVVQKDHVGANLTKYGGDANPLCGVISIPLAGGPSVFRSGNTHTHTRPQQIPNSKTNVTQVRHHEPSWLF